MCADRLQEWYLRKLVGLVYIIRRYKPVGLLSRIEDVLRIDLYLRRQSASSFRARKESVVKSRSVYQFDLKTDWKRAVLVAPPKVMAIGSLSHRDVTNPRQIV